MSNLEALAEQLELLNDSSRPALVQALRSMAEALDGNPGNAQLWKQYLTALELLTGDDDGSDLASTIAEIERAAQVGYAEAKS